MNKPLFCPVCKKQLVVRQQLRLETLDEHISDPNRTPCLKPAFQCPDGKCPTRLIGCIWDDFEGNLFYVEKRPSIEEKAAIPFIDGLTAPFGSFNRGWEAAKRAEAKTNKHLLTFPKWFPGVFSQMEVHTNWTYHANDNGEITKRHFGLHWIHFDPKSNLRTIHMWGMRMLKYSIYCDLRAWWALRRDPTSGWHRNQLEDTVKRMEWRDPEWWRILSGKFAKFLLKCLPEKPLTTY